MSSLRQFLGKLKGYLTPDDASYAADGGKLVTRGDNGEGQFATTSSTAVEGNASTNGNGGSFSSDSGVGSISASTTGIGAIIASEGGDVIQFYGNAGQVGGMSNAGAFSAVSFSGSGAGLTGLTSSQITDATDAATPSTVVLRGSQGNASFAATNQFTYPVQATNSSTSGLAYAVLGNSINGVAIYGNATGSGRGVSGNSDSGNGIEGTTVSGIAIYGYSALSDLLQLEGGSGVVFTVSNAGVITADGSGLTGLVSSQITDASSGDIDGAAANKVAKFSSGGDISARVFSARSITIGGPSTGGLTIGNPSDVNANLKATNLTTDRNFEFPDAAGTLALTTSNVATATALATSRNIFNIPFDGTANVSGDATNAGHFASIPSGGGAGHFITLNGTAPTIIAGRSAWFSDGSGNPSFKNGTGAAVTLVRSSDLGTGVATWLATPSSANLRAAMTDEVGTGALYFVGGALSTPASGTLTNCTGLPISTGVNGLASGVATFLATPSSANLRSAVTDETGTGALVFADAPTFATSITVSGSNATGVIVASTSSSTGSISVASLMAANSTGDVYFSVGKALTNTNSALIGYSTTGATSPYAFMTTYGRAASDLCVNTNGSVGMGTATPSTKAKLEISSTTQGFLPPRMTTTQRDAITSPVAGLMIYNTTTNKLNVYTTAWEAVTSA